MAKASKSQMTKATPHTTITASAASVKTSKSKSKSTEKVTKTEKVEVAPVDVVESTPTVTASSDTPDVVLSEAFSEFMATFQNLVSQMNALKSKFRDLEKKTMRELKASQKLNSKRKRKAGNRSPSGFVKPTLISEELASFLKKPKGTEMARTEVTREINGYIRQHNLQDKQNGRKINPDTHLATLLKITSADELTYFNLQRYMSPHFAKAGSSLPKVDQPVETATPSV